MEISTMASIPDFCTECGKWGNACECKPWCAMCGKPKSKCLGRGACSPWCTTHGNEACECLKMIQGKERIISTRIISPRIKCAQ